VEGGVVPDAVVRAGFGTRNCAVGEKSTERRSHSMVPAGSPIQAWYSGGDASRVQRHLRGGPGGGGRLRRDDGAGLLDAAQGVEANGPERQVRARVEAGAFVEPAEEEQGPRFLPHGVGEPRRQGRGEASRPQRVVVAPGEDEAHGPEGVVPGGDGVEVATLVYGSGSPG
jgi:hypothetical protein